MKEMASKVVIVEVEWLVVRKAGREEFGQAIMIMRSEFEERMMVSFVDLGSLSGELIHENSVRILEA
jgi:hypothetical protein